MIVEVWAVSGAIHLGVNRRNQMGGWSGGCRCLEQRAEDVLGNVW